MHKALVRITSGEVIRIEAEQIDMELYDGMALEFLCIDNGYETKTYGFPLTQVIRWETWEETE